MTFRNPWNYEHFPVFFFDILAFEKREKGSESERGSKGCCRFLENLWPAISRGITIKSSGHVRWGMNINCNYKWTTHFYPPVCHWQHVPHEKPDEQDNPSWLNTSIMKPIEWHAFLHWSDQSQRHVSKDVPFWLLSVLISIQQRIFNHTFLFTQS